MKKSPSFKKVNDPLTTRADFRIFSGWNGAKPRVPLAESGTPSACVPIGSQCFINIKGIQFWD
jgi:hypothetical protein